MKSITNICRAVATVSLATWLLPAVLHCGPFAVEAELGLAKWLGPADLILQQRSESRKKPPLKPPVPGPPEFDYEWPQPINECATRDEKRWQPALDFDTDSCYNVAAIGVDGLVSRGANIAGDVEQRYLSGPCRRADRIPRMQVYSRHACNHHWCAYAYSYYFEKNSHRNASRDALVHDWQHIVVWVRQSNIGKCADMAEWVSWRVSRDPRYKWKHSSQLFWEGDRVKMVHHKPGHNLFTRIHEFRPAKTDDVVFIENHTGKWIVADLLGWTGWPSLALRNRLGRHGWNGIYGFPMLPDGWFEWLLDKAIPGAIRTDGFDAQLNDEPTTYPKCSGLHPKKKKPKYPSRPPKGNEDNKDGSFHLGTTWACNCKCDLHSQA